MDSNIFNLVRSSADIDTTIGEIDTLLDSLYRTGDSDFEHTLNSRVRKDTAKFVQGLNSAKEVKKQELESLKVQLREAKVIKLTLAFEASNDIAEKISIWLRKNIDPNVVLSTNYDQSIIGGAIIEYQGKYADMSLRKKLDQILA